MYMHTMKGGRRVAINDMDDNHLLNTIKLIDRKAHKGLIITTGGGNQMGDMWMDQELLEGKEALDYMNHEAYVDEAVKRGIIKGNYN